MHYVVCCRFGVYWTRTRICSICNEISISSHSIDHILTLQCRWTGNLVLTLPAILSVLAILL